MGVSMDALKLHLLLALSGRTNCPWIRCRTFADGFPNLFVKDATKIRNRHVAFLASFQHPISIFEQLSIIYQLPRMFVGSFTVVLPYFPTGTAERVSTQDPCMQTTPGAAAFYCMHVYSDLLYSFESPFLAYNQYSSLPKQSCPLHGCIWCCSCLFASPL